MTVLGILGLVSTMSPFVFSVLSVLVYHYVAKSGSPAAPATPAQDGADAVKHPLLSKLASRLEQIAEAAVSGVIDNSLGGAKSPAAGGNLLNMLPSLLNALHGGSPAANGTDLKQVLDLLNALENAKHGAATPAK